MSATTKAAKATKAAAAKATTDLPTASQTTDKAHATNGEATAKAGRKVGNSGKSPAERRLVVVKAMRRMKATSTTNAVTAERLAKATGLTKFDVYGQLYHTHPLQTGEFVRQHREEAANGGLGRTLYYYLTAKGVKATDEEIIG